jgi:Flp pilus assembly protein TadB
MFIWTISDVVAAIIFLVFVIAAICAIIPAYSESRRREREESARREEERKKREDEARKAFYDARRQAAIKRNKDWAAKHPKGARLLDAITSHPIITSIIGALIIMVAVAVAIVLNK